MSKDNFSDILSRPSAEPNRRDKYTLSAEIAASIEAARCLRILDIVPGDGTRRKLPTVIVSMDADTKLCRALRAENIDSNRFPTGIVYHSRLAEPFYLTFEDAAREYPPFQIALDPIEHRHFFVDAAAAGAYAVRFITPHGAAEIAFYVEPREFLDALADAMTSRLKGVNDGR